MGFGGGLTSLSHCRLVCGVEVTELLASDGRETAFGGPNFHCSIIERNTTQTIASSTSTI